MTTASNPMVEGRIVKAVSGLYYVDTGDKTVRCRARGRFRYDKLTPLVGDIVSISMSGDEGVIDAVSERRNAFTRPPVSNIDQMIIVAANAIPVTAPFLIDRMAAIAEHAGAEPIVCINKCDLDPAQELYGIYSSSGFRCFRVSAVTGEGIGELMGALRGKLSVFTGNSGVGKSSILNALESSAAIPVGEVSQKLGRGRHTTRHVEIYRTAFGAMIADTPGFSSFDLERMELTDPEELQYAFHDFAPYLGECRFTGCAHVKEAGCAVLEAVKAGKIQPSRHQSYVRIYEQLKSVNRWERKPVKP